ncbi:MAG: peptidoglycan DD-metalloendopeptidase family protein [Alphaproteobacteria bacterium]|nr:peptidoglycan DD-metalloendopeptidase family protein [Alphaproteobacteria bacterium]
MKRLLAAALIALAGCAAAETPPEPQPVAEPIVETPAPAPPPAATAPVFDPTVAQPLAAGHTDAVAAPTLQPIGASPAPRDLTLRCAGAFQQGGAALCRTQPGARIVVDGADRGAADANGWAVIGFDRDSPGESVVEARAGAAAARESFVILPRSFDVQRVDGLPPQTVTPTDPAVLARIARERDIKNVGFASRANAEGWLDGFRWPVEGRISSSWGNQRVLNGEPRSPHYGVDIAMPTGTPIRAPAGGVVSLAEPDLHFEGGLVLIDHGQGLISMYLHMSRLDVRAGDAVTQGQVIGAVGSSGRTTGPHLCWRLKWRDRNLDPAFAILGLAEARRALASGT